MAHYHVFVHLLKGDEYIRRFLETYNEHEDARKRALRAIEEASEEIGEKLYAEELIEELENWNGDESFNLDAQPSPYLSESPPDGIWEEQGFMTVEILRHL